MADSLIRQMSGLRSLKVINLNTVLNFKGQAVDPRAAGKQLGAEAVLSGSIERQVDRLVISARLIDVATGRELWTNNFNRAEADLLDVQDEIASAIMNDGLRVRLTNDQQRRLARRPTVDGEAYDLYLQSAYLQRRATEEDYLYSRELLKRAVARDPQYARALAALSGNYGMMATDGFERPTDAWPEVSRYMRLGRNLKEVRIGVDVGQRLDAISPKLSVSGRYSYAIVEKVSDLPNNRSNMGIESIFQVTRQLGASVGFRWQRSHGGLRSTEFVTEELFEQYDRLIKDNNFHISTGIAYSFRRFDVFASYLHYASGTDTHVGRAITTGVSLPFER